MDCTTTAVLSFIAPLILWFTWWLVGKDIVVGAVSWAVREGLKETGEYTSNRIVITLREIAREIAERRAETEVSKHMMQTCHWDENYARAVVRDEVEKFKRNKKKGEV